MNTLPLPSFNEFISLIKAHEPETWKRYEQSFNFDKSFVSHDLQNTLIKKDAIKYLKGKIRTLQDDMSSLRVKFGIRVYFNGESEKLIDEICAKIRLASIKDFHNKEKYDKLIEICQRRLKPQVNNLRSGSFDQEEMLNILNELEDLIEGDEEIQAELSKFNYLINIGRLNEKDRLDIVFDQVLSIHINSLMLNWLHEQLQLVQNEEACIYKKLQDEYENILQPIPTRKDPQIFIGALDFFWNEKNCKGESFLSKYDVYNLKKIGYRIPIEGKEPPIIFEPKVYKEDKDLFYGFLYVAGSTMAIRQNNWKSPIIAYHQNYFPSLIINDNSLRTAIDTPSPENLRIIKPYFIRKKQTSKVNNLCINSAIR